jgi:hypothetical protein
VQKATVQLNSILGDLQEGRGLAGSVLKDDTLRRQFADTVANLSIVSSNLAAHGLLWKPPRRPQVFNNSPVYTGKRP